MTDTTPDTLFAVAGQGPGKPLYHLWHADPLHDDGEGYGVPAGTFRSLTDAMDACSNLCDGLWITEPGRPDLLFHADRAAGCTTKPARPIWTIEAGGVAREFASTIPDALRAMRQWSPLDGQIIDAVIAETTGIHLTWWLARSEATAAGELLAAWFATGRGHRGALSTADVRNVLAAAFQMAYASRRPIRQIPADVIAGLAAALAARLIQTGVPVTGGNAMHVPPVPAGAHVVVVDGKAGPHRRSWPAWTSDYLAMLQRADAQMRTPPARKAAAPLWTAWIPAGRLPAILCAALSGILSRLLLPAAVMAAGIAATRQPWPWQPAADWLSWVWWATPGLAVGLVVEIRLQPRAAMGRPSARPADAAGISLPDSRPSAGDLRRGGGYQR